MGKAGILLLGLADTEKTFWDERCTVQWLITPVHGGRRTKGITQIHAFLLNHDHAGVTEGFPSCICGMKGQQLDVTSQAGGQACCNYPL